MSVLIENMQNKIAITDNISGLLNRIVDMGLKLEGLDTPSEVSFMLVDNEAIREINKEYRHIDKATDVLSFPMVDMVEGEIINDTGDFDLDEELLVLGDIVISMEKVAEQSQSYGHSFERELAFLASHGLFHLLGYDHQDEEHEKRMLEKQEAVLQQLGLGRE
ncbi:MAG: rRNA maturation RNase YbeY [Clostridia bacterium]|nr:rRNA maturation RNase YbeY [Clostridia bacterium]